MSMILYFILFFSSFILTYLVKLFAQKKMLLDTPNERSSHVTPTPRGGGLAIALVWFAGISFLYISEQIQTNLYYALLSGILISGVSLIDDIYTIKPLPRMIVQCISAFFALYFIGGLKVFDFGFLQIENPFLLNALAFIGIVWFTNLFNFIDGIDGYSASGALSIALMLFFFVHDNLLLVLGSAVLGFLLWNWQKAKIFMGDIGSTLLGFTVSVLIIYYNNTAQFSLLNGLIITSIYWFDATFTLLKRYRNKERLSQAHRKHAFQRIVQFGYSHQKTVLLTVFINLMLFFAAIVAQLNKNYVVLILGAVILFLFLLYKQVDAKKPFHN